MSKINEFIELLICLFSLFIFDSIIVLIIGLWIGIKISMIIGIILFLLSTIFCKKIKDL